MSYIITTLFTFFIGLSLLLICLFVSYSYSDAGQKYVVDIINKNNHPNAAKDSSNIVESDFELLGILTSVHLMYNFLMDLWDRSDDFVELRTTWICSIIGALAVVSAGIVPALLLPVDSGPSLHSGAGAIKLNRLLCFAVGSLLGDVFLHLLPETWNSNGGSNIYIGLWIIAGLLVCFLVEKFCARSVSCQHRVAAIMNLTANIMDNFTHGLAVGGSFLVNIRFGVLTTFAILVHEIPHEISDFAILLRADFDRWSAIKAQLFTAVGGIVGATVALATQGVDIDQKAAWILPFTAGGFLHIALVQVLPDILKERRLAESIKQLLLIAAGISTMGLINVMHS